ncbi:MAG: intradiol ring-cleavage dioxygenase, partial [Acidimicrobiia bacterium]
GNDDGDSGATDDTAATDDTGTSTTATAAPAASGSAEELLNAAGACALTPEQTEGPYYLDIDSVRNDIREDREGTVLRLAIRVRENGTCTPVANAAVDIWHCDATGLYSGFESASTGGGGGGPGPGGGGGPGPGGGGGGGGGATATDNTRYLRGTQITNAAGIVEFTTVYPGWYTGRTVHIHTKVHLNNTEVLTSQLYFDEKLSSEVYAAQPYAGDTGRNTFNTDDGIFQEETILTVTKDGSGYLGVINLDVKSA